MSQAMWGLHMAEIAADLPIKQGFIGIGWPEMGNLADLPKNRDAFKARLAETHPTEKPGAVPVKAGVLYRFAHDMAVGDVVVYPSKPDRMVHLGVIEGGYVFHPTLLNAYPHRRKVRWMRAMPRADFSQSALYEIGSAITLFQISTHADEFRAALEGQSTGADDVDADTADEVSIQVEESTEDFIIKRLKTKMTPYEFEKFVAHLLTCMGYHARVTKQSSDGGIDIIAHKDELGFEPPIIKVQCKQTLEPIGRPKVQELHGAVELGEHGLFVTLGPFSAQARDFERSKPNLRLIDGNALIDLIYAHYERFDTRYKLLMPLKRTYIPGSVLTAVD
ncbi:restriction endonuclease [Rhodospirillum sp. A1_3_36]|uniref:restriction endonuclease n=1 Tax=Rhodospirillum sp. A1_3_36 TaxID=3391666 RepID=UPI0039A62DB0